MSRLTHEIEIHLRQLLRTEAASPDWDTAAEELKMDYTTVEFGGKTYYIR